MRAGADEGGGAAKGYRDGERSSIHARSVPKRVRLSLPQIG